MIVVDASVAVKWFLPESGSDLAGALFEAEDRDLAGPDILAVEVCATLVRGANMVKSNRPDAERKLAKFQAMLDAGDVRLVRTLPDDVGRAAQLALSLGHPLKDCLYLALARDRACPLLTADARFAARARGVHDAVRLLEG